MEKKTKIEINPEARVIPFGVHKVVMAGVRGKDGTMALALAMHDTDPSYGYNALPEECRPSSDKFDTYLHFPNEESLSNLIDFLYQLKGGFNENNKNI